MATPIEQQSRNRTPGFCQERPEKTVAGTQFFAAGIKIIGEVHQFPKIIGSISEKPILMAARSNVNATSHLCGLRYCKSIFICIDVQSGIQSESTIPNRKVSRIRKIPFTVNQQHSRKGKSSIVSTPAFAVEAPVVNSFCKVLREDFVRS